MQWHSTHYCHLLLPLTNDVLPLLPLTRILCYWIWSLLHPLPLTFANHASPEIWSCHSCSTASSLLLTLPSHPRSTCISLADTHSHYRVALALTLARLTFSLPFDLEMECATKRGFSVSARDLINISSARRSKKCF